MKILSLITILFTVTLVSGLLFWGKNNWCFFGGVREYWSLEIADTPQEHTRGLMYRKHLCPRCGMLFIFENEVPQTFWMKNTFIPLDIYFYDNHGKLVDKVLSMKPDSQRDPPMTYTSRLAQYVVEVESGSPWQYTSISQGSCL